MVFVPLVAVCTGAWWLARPSFPAVLVPGAEDLQVEVLGFGEQQVSYRAPGQPYGWYFTIVRNLAADGWSAPVDNRLGMRHAPETHWRILQLWFIYLKEEVALQGEPHVAHIRVRRELIIPWRRYLP
jgi:hypothetical protein